MSEKSAIEKLLNPNSKGRQAQHFQRFCFSRNMIYTIKKKRKTLRKINYIQRNVDDKRSARH